MALEDFDSIETIDAQLANRFSPQSFGIAQFRDMAGNPNNFEELLKILARLRQQELGSRGIVCPRLFISHQRHDRQKALRVAWLAHQAGFHFWLDVLDPVLAGLAGTPAKAAIALVVEFALLNCSHILAVMTPNTEKSKWVPYEYGRAKDPTPVSIQAAAWIAPGLTDFGEYLYLGPMHKTEMDITRWLLKERKDWLSHTPGCHLPLNRPWYGSPTLPLPHP